MKYAVIQKDITTFEMVPAEPKLPDKIVLSILDFPLEEQAEAFLEDLNTPRVKPFSVSDILSLYRQYTKAPAV